MNFSMDFGGISFEKASELYVSFDKINFQTIVNESFFNDDSILRIFGEASKRDGPRTHLIKETLT